jgi:nicotinate-nucleotide adenylyltransferase
LRLALFGGAFDPIHNAHLRIARDAAALCRLDRVLFVPAAHPPHKRIHAPYEDRFRMVELALDGEPGMAASRLEADTTQSFSIDTIEKLKPELAAGDELFFLIGADAFAEIRTWKRWQDVVRAVEFIVVSRPGHTYDIPEGARAERLDTLQLPVSSSEIRAKLAAGRTDVEAPPAVLEYIRKKHLYSGQSRPFEGKLSG